jgi:hypothetical protein
MSPLPPPKQGSNACLLITIPQELQVNFLSYLRAFDMASVQQTCRFYAAPPLMDAIVRHVAERVYPAELSEGYDRQPVQFQREANLLTVEHLRNMELVVIARVLSRPEPASGTGYVVSKSWCKAALKWLEGYEQQRQQQAQQSKKKLNRKQRVRNRRLSDVSPPWPNCNADILCAHANLICMSNKSARARRKLIDRQSWKAISNLYPDSTPLESLVGECIMCRSEALTAKQEADLKDQMELQRRKKPLDRPVIRQFYTRTRGVPTQAVKQGDSGAAGCPLEDGVYYILPRVWCQGWRRYIKTGEVGGHVGSSISLPKAASASDPLPPAPDTTCLLCAAHRLPLFPAHLEAYLYRHTDTLFPNSSATEGDDAAAPEAAAAAPARAVPVGQVEPVDQSILQALQAAGLSPAEVARQLQAMRILEHERLNNASLNVGGGAAASASYYSPPDDWVEILTREEYTTLLEEQRWSGSVPDPAEGVSFVVKGGSVTRFLPKSPCRDCHPAARRYCCTSSSKANDLKKTVSKQKKHRGGSKVSRPSLSPMNLEY